MSEPFPTTDEVRARLAARLQRLAPTFVLDEHPAIEIATAIEELAWSVVADFMDIANERIEAMKATAHSEKGEG